MTQEIYALSLTRSAALAESFLDKFLPIRAVFANEFPVPEFSDTPTQTFRLVDELLVFLEANQAEPYSIYWNSRNDGTIRQAMLFYTSDKHLIVGLAVMPNMSKELFSLLLEFTGSKFGIFGSEQPPPETAREFEELAREASHRKEPNAPTN